MIEGYGRMLALKGWCLKTKTKKRSKVMQKVKSVVNKFIDDGFMFTVWDVTATLRNQGEKIRHSEVRDVLHGMFRSGEMKNYLRDIVDLELGTNPYCYYHPSCDIENYDEFWIVSNPTQDGMKADTTNNTLSNTNPIPDNNSVSQNDSDSSDQIISLTSENRLNVSPALMSSIGLNPGDDYSVAYADSSLKLFVCPTPSGLRGSVNKVNSDGRGRISLVHLKNCFPNTWNSSHYKMNVRNGYIEITPA
jgi:hypothetical protein